MPRFYRAPRISLHLLLWLLFLLLPLSLSAQLRIVTWNISNYGGGRTADIQNAVYGVFSGRSLAPDVILGQEFLTQIAVDDFRNALNGAPGSPGDWAAASFVNGLDTDSAFFYRASKVQYLGYVIVATGSTAANPRNIMRYNIELKGYVNNAPKIACYSSHMKAGSSDTDMARRLIESQRIRDNAEALPADWSFVLGGDFNIPASFEAAYVELVGAQSNNRGRFFDPINTPGDWNNTFAYRFVHTQDPATQMDDRFDQLLVSSDLIDGEGFDYIGNPALPYSTTTWNDPNHSYRSWGNDGGNYNGALRTSTNTMVGPTIGQALINLASGQGHLPVFLDLHLPPSLSIVSGAVSLQESVNLIQPITFTFRPISGGPNITREATLTETGTFSFNDIPSADYTLAIKGAKWLQKTLPVNVTTANANDLSVTLTAGDANDDNSVDVLDLDLLLQAFDLTPADPFWNINADFNCDESVDVLDLDLLLRNFDTNGDE